jgi:hypothetical protein
MVHDRVAVVRFNVDGTAVLWERELTCSGVCGGSSVNVNDGSEDSEFRHAIKVLAERVGNLAQQRGELLERCTMAEGNQAQLKKELENQAEIVKSLYAKRKFDKQV